MRKGRTRKKILNNNNTDSQSSSSSSTSVNKPSTPPDMQFARFSNSNTDNTNESSPSSRSSSDRENRKTLTVGGNANRNSSGNANNNNGNLGTNGGNGSNIATAEKKHVDPQIASLTAKNYRLAKELSDLRIRYKEEMKTVTRLTTENMNLASRCRQAISHVDMLQKELGFQEKKYAELEKRQQRSNHHVSKRSPIESTITSTNAMAGTPKNNNNILMEDIKVSNVSPAISPLQTMSSPTEPMTTISPIHVTTAKSFTPQDNSSSNSGGDTPSHTSKSVNGKTAGKGELLPEIIHTPVEDDDSKLGYAANNANNHNSNNSTKSAGETNFRGLDIIDSNQKSLKENDKLSSSFDEDQNHQLFAVAKENNTFDTPTVTRNNNDMVESDVAFGELHLEDFFTGSSPFQSTLPVTPEKENIDIETMNDQFQNFSFEDKIKENGSNEENSYDAFEASFQRTFPSSFSQPLSTERAFSLDEVFNDDSGFFADSTPSNSVTSTPSNNTKSNDESQPPSLSLSHSNSSNRSKDRISRDPSLSSSYESAPDDELIQFPSYSQESSESSTISTPPSKSTISSDKSSSPPSEKQSGGAAARARYKYSFSDPDENIAPMDEAQADRVETASPTLVLQRLQQRKVRDKTNHHNDDGNSSLSEKIENSVSLSEEMRKLDAIAAGTLTTRSSYKPNSRRRAVKQPISYAEPSLSSKLRRGDVFFPKHDVENEVKS